MRGRQGGWGRCWAVKDCFSSSITVSSFSLSSHGGLAPQHKAELSVPLNKPLPLRVNNEPELELDAAHVPASGSGAGLQDLACRARPTGASLQGPQCCWTFSTTEQAALAAGIICTNYYELVIIVIIYNYNLFIICR